jgi:hypothetical protein
MFILMVLYDFWLLLAQFCYIRKIESRVQINRGPVYTLENLQWFRQPCFAGAAILGSRRLPQIPS